MIIIIITLIIIINNREYICIASATPPQAGVSYDNKKIIKEEVEGIIGCGLELPHISLKVIGCKINNKKIMINKLILFGAESAHSQ